MNKIILLSILLIGCGNKTEDNFQCDNCNNDECDIMYVSPQTVDVGTGGVK